jgi:hypothetical protein
MLVVLTNAVKVESVPLNFNFFAEIHHGVRIRTLDATQLPDKCLI